MSLKKLMRDLVDAVDGAGHEFKRGFSGAFRKRGGKHRADADAIRGLDRRNRDSVPKHRRDDKPVSHRREYDIREEARRGYESLGHEPRHRNPDYHPARDLGGAVGQGVRSVPGDLLGEVKGVPKKVPKQFVEELYEDAIGQDNPDKYGATSSGDMRFLAPASEAATLAALDAAALAERFGIDPASVQGASIEIRQIPGSRFVSVEVARD